MLANGVRLSSIAAMAADSDDLDNVDREIRLNRLRSEVEDRVESGEEP